MIPSKADEQEAFKNEKLEPRLEEAQSGKRAVSWMLHILCFFFLVSFGVLNDCLSKLPAESVTM